MGVRPPKLECRGPPRGRGPSRRGRRIVSLLVAVAYVLMGGDRRSHERRRFDGTRARSAGRETPRDFVSVCSQTRRVWRDSCLRRWPQLRRTHLVLFSGQVESPAHGESAVGPFYLPGDAKVYVDSRFYAELQSRFQAPGDFAQHSDRARSGTPRAEPPRHLGSRPPGSAGALEVGGQRALRPSELQQTSSPACGRTTRSAHAPSSTGATSTRR